MAIFNTINEAVRYGIDDDNIEYTSDAAYSIFQLIEMMYKSEAKLALSLGYDPHSLPDMINMFVCICRDIPLVGESSGVVTPGGPDGPEVS